MFFSCKFGMVNGLNTTIVVVLYCSITFHYFSFVFHSLHFFQILQLYFTGDVMPQNGMNYEGRRRGTSRNTCKASNWAPSTGLVNGAVAYNGCPAATTGTTDSTSPGTLNDTNPPCMVNGDVNHGKKGKSRKAIPPRTTEKQGSTISAVSDASAAGRVSSAATPGGISVNGATSLDTVAMPCNSDQMSRKPSLYAAAKKQRRWNKFARKKRCASYLTDALNKLFSPKFTFMHHCLHTCK